MRTDQWKDYGMMACGLFIFAVGCHSAYLESHRHINSAATIGVITNLHTESAAKSTTLHFQVKTPDGILTRDLYTEEGLMFMKAANGKRVELTYTQQTGYISSLHFISGTTTGYAYSEPDGINIHGPIILALLGLLIAFVGFADWYGSSSS